MRSCKTDKTPSCSKDEEAEAEVYMKAVENQTEIPTKQMEEVDIGGDCMTELKKAKKKQVVNFGIGKVITYVESDKTPSCSKDEREAYKSGKKV